MSFLKSANQLHTYIENSNPKNNSEITPMVGILDIEVVREELVARARWAVLARGGRVDVVQVASVGGDVSAEVLLAGLTAGRVDDGEFLVRADDLGAADRWRGIHLST